MLVTNAANKDRVDPSLVEHVLLLDDELLAGGEPEFDGVDTAADDPAQLYYSSGTTGLAKGIVHAHRYLLAHEEFVYCHDVQDGERLPRHGRVGVGRRASRRCSARGGSARCSSSTSARAASTRTSSSTSSRATRSTNVFTTPTAMRSMMSIDGRRQALPAEVPDRLLGGRAAEPGGDPLVPRAVRPHRARLLRAHGVLSARRQLPVHGRPRGLDGQADARLGRAILDEDEKPLPQGERGEICLRARSNPHYPIGYWRNDEASEETFGGEWFHTKDAASVDEDGYVWYEGRADDVIIAAGYRIGPFEVESACLEHPAVAEAAAVASPDERRGSVVKAFIVLAEGHEGSDELVKEIQTHVRDRLSAYAYPRKIEFVDELPEDADRQDPPDRAAPGRAGGREDRR